MPLFLQTTSITIITFNYIQAGTTHSCKKSKTISKQEETQPVQRFYFQLVFIYSFKYYTGNPKKKKQMGRASSMNPARRP